MSTMSQNDLNLISAFIDGELDAPASLAVETRIARDPAFAHEYEAMMALGQSVGARLGRETASDRLKGLLETAASPPPRIRSRPPPGWAQLALAAGLAAVVASGTTYGLLEPGLRDEASDTLVAAHLRGLIAQRPIDVETSDRHTVKPWFNERLSFAPLVPEEPIPGFDLLGGRVDVVDGQPAGTLVYKHKSHFASLTQARTGLADAPLVSVVHSGLTEMRWRKGGLAFTLISDLPGDELAVLARHWQ